MRLETRLLAVTALSFSAAVLIAGFLSFRIEIRQARDDVDGKARMLIESAAAVRDYTDNEIAPLVDHVTDTGFLPQQVPAYAAHATMLNLQRQYPEFQYHEAGVNPTNTSNRASDWEAGLVRE